MDIDTSEWWYRWTTAAYFLFILIWHCNHHFPLNGWQKTTFLWENKLQGWEMCTCFTLCSPSWDFHLQFFKHLSPSFSGIFHIHFSNIFSPSTDFHLIFPSCSYSQSDSMNDFDIVSKCPTNAVTIWCGQLEDVFVNLHV